MAKNDSGSVVLRRLNIIAAIKKCGVMTIDELAEKFGVTPMTIQNDITEIEIVSDEMSRFGVNIEFNYSWRYDKEVYILNSLELEKLAELTELEKELLLVSLRIQHEREPKNKNISSLIKKFGSDRLPIITVEKADFLGEVIQ